MSSVKAASPTEAAAPGFALRLSLLYGAIFLLVGCQMPYFPVWLKWRGLSPDEIGMILAAPLAMRLAFTPVISFSADRSGDRRRMLILLAWGALASFCALLAAGGFWSILVVGLFASLFWTSIMPLTEAVAMEGVRRAGLDYGRMRTWGSLTFIAMSFGGGVALQRWGPSTALWLMIASAACVVLVVHLLPRPAGKGRLKSLTLPPKIRVRDAWALARSPLFLLFLLATGTVQSTHAIYYAFGTIHWEAQGISTAVIGLLWSVGVMAEILLFLYAKHILMRMDPARLLLLAASASVLRWAITALSPPLWLLFPVQALHGLTFGAAHLAAVHFISDVVPDNATGTAQGLFAAFTSGILMGIAIAAAGPLYAALGAYAYMAMAGVGMISAAAALALGRVRDSGAVIRFAGE